MSQIESKNATVYINWKGFLYIIPISQLMTHSTGCCDNVILNVEVNLTNNVITINNLVYIPILTTFSTPDQVDFNMSLGYLKVLKNDFKTIISSNESAYLTELNITNKNNKRINYYIFNLLAEKTSIFEFNHIAQLKQTITDNFVIPWKIDETNTEYFRDLSLITNQFDYNWTEKIILNNNTYVIQNYKQCFVNTQFFKNLRR